MKDFINGNSWFHFKEESNVTGWTFWWRNIVSIFALFLFVVPGLWLAASTWYKRAAAFNLSRELIIGAAVCGVLNTIATVLNKTPGYIDSDWNWFDTISLPAGFIYLALFFANGNKSNKTV